MRYEISNRPSYSVLDVVLEQGETVAAESGAMAWMDEGVEIKTSSRTGVFSGLKRKFLAGESFFQNRFTAMHDGCGVSLAPGSAGDICPYLMEDSELFLQKGAYLASSEGVRCDAKFDGLRGFFNEGFFVLRATGTGHLFFSSYGDIEPIEVDGRYLVDNGYAVAWEPSLTWRLTKSRRIRSFLFSEQFLLEFSGRGTVWVQSRSPQSFANWVHPFRMVKSKSSSSDD